MVIVMDNNDALLTRTQICRSYGVTRRTFGSYEALGYIKPAKRSLSGKQYFYFESDIKRMFDRINKILEGYCSLEQAAEMVGVHPATLRIAIRDGRLRPSQLPFITGNHVYYKRSDIETLIISMYLKRRRLK